MSITSSTLACPYHSCPGCPGRDMTYEQQLEAKAARLRASLARYPSLAALVPEAIVPAAHIVDYRHRAKLPLEAASGALRMGLFTTEGRQVVDTPGCPVLHPEVRAVLLALRPWLGEAGVAAPAGPVTGVDVRWVALARACQVTLACKGGELPGGAHAARRLRREIPAIGTLAVSRSDARGFRVLGDAPEVVGGPGTLPEKIGATAYRLAPGAFFQVDPRQAVSLGALVADALRDARRVADVYCGVGAYALALAPRCEAVVGIDESGEAIEAARLAATEAGLEGRVRFVEGAAEEVLAGALEAGTASAGEAGTGESSKTGGSFDGLVLNPARRGAHPRALEAIIRAAPARVAYVSCDPDTLARDLDHLHWAGYQAARVSPVDLFPQTFEVETVVALRKGPPPAPPPAQGTGVGRGARIVALAPWRCARPAKGAGAARPVFLPPDGASGAAVLEGPWPGRVRVLALVAGAVPARGGRAGAGAYERVEALPGALGRRGWGSGSPSPEGALSLVRLHVPPASITGALGALAKSGFPVLGGPEGDRAAGAAAAARAGLARPFVHVEGLDWRDARADAPLPGDLALALERLRARV